MAKLCSFDSLEIKGETIKEIFFLEVSGGEKTFIVFESGTVLILPVYKKCPVQFGRIEDLRRDFSEFILRIQKEKGELDRASNKIQELEKWLGQQEIPSP